MHSVVEKLLAVVADERHNGLLRQTQLFQFREDPGELRVHGANGSVVPVELPPNETLVVDSRLRQLLGRRQRQAPADACLDERPHLLHFAVVLVLPGGIRPFRIEGCIGLERRVGIEKMQENEKGRVTVQLDPRKKTVDVSLRVLAASPAFREHDRAGLVGLRHLDANW